MLLSCEATVAHSRSSQGFQIGPALAGARVGLVKFAAWLPRVRRRIMNKRSFLPGVPRPLKSAAGSKDSFTEWKQRIWSLL